MSLPTALLPLLASAGGGDGSTLVMPFVLLGAVLVLAGLLLFFLGRQRRRNRDHQG